MGCPLNMLSSEQCRFFFKEQEEILKSGLRNVVELPLLKNEMQQAWWTIVDQCAEHLIALLMSYSCSKCISFLFPFHASRHFSIGGSCRSVVCPIFNCMGMPKSSILHRPLPAKTLCGYLRFCGSERKLSDFLTDPGGRNDDIKVNPKIRVRPIRAKLQSIFRGQYR